MIGLKHTVAILLVIGCSSGNINQSKQYDSIWIKTHEYEYLLKCKNPQKLFAFNNSLFCEILSMTFSEQEKLKYNDSLKKYISVRFVVDLYGKVIHADSLKTINFHISKNSEYLLYKNFCNIFTYDTTNCWSYINNMSQKYDTFVVSLSNKLCKIK